VALAINLELSHGRHGASARVELHERGDGTVALFAVRGWIDRVALRRLSQTLDDLAGRKVGWLLLDCSQLRHIDLGLVASLVEALSRFESHPGQYLVCGLSQRLRELFRVAGCEPSRHCWPSASELLASSLALEPRREWAS